MCNIRMFFSLSAMTLVFLSSAVPAAGAPAKMDAIVQSQVDGIDVLKMESVDTPKPGPNQILIQVYAAAVNPVDWKRRPGQTTLPSGSVLAPIPGYDVAGVVDSLGSGVTTWKVGDAVFARVTGAFAQYAVVDADAVGAKPRRFTFEQAAGMPIAGVAGLGAAEAGKVSKGQHVAIIGAAGGAGSAAVDVVRARGAKIIASGHSSQQSWLREQGVDEFVAYDKENVASRIKDVDVVLNMVDGQAEPALAYVKRGGTLSSIAGLPPPEKCAAAGVTCVTIRGNVPGMTGGQALAALSALADEGKYMVRVTKTYPLAQAAAAQEFAHRGETMGKIVLIVDSRSKNH